MLAAPSTVAADPLYIPLPSAAPPAQLPRLVPDQPDEAWRLHWEPNPRAPHAHAQGRYRFDAPDGEYPVTYLCDDQAACFAEVYADRQEIGPDQGDRLLSELTYTRPLLLVPLDDGQALRKLDQALDGRIATTR